MEQTKQVKTITYTVSVSYDAEMSDQKIKSIGDYWLEKWQENEEVCLMDIDESEIELEELECD